MNQNRMRYLTFVCAIGLLIGCKTKPVIQTRPDSVILTIGNQQIKTDDFFQSFTKNQFSADTTKQMSVEDYLELYINLKLKVVAAQKEGRDTTTDFKEEIATLRRQLSQPFLSDKLLIDNLVAEAYQRSKEEIRASHILIAVSPDASPADTLSAYRAALALRGRIIEGEGFAEMAIKLSKDFKTASEGGDLGYFTVFQTVYPFETAAYQLESGKISNPVRTSSGYHLIKVTDRRAARGKLQVAHVLVSMSNSANPEGQIAAKNRIEEAYERIRQGESFEVVCREYSTDQTTKNNGGVLGAFGTGQWVPSFEDAAYSLKKIGDVSKPFKTNYGWHIIKLINRLAIPTFQESATLFRQKVVTDSRKEIIAESMSQKLRKQYKIDENSDVKDDAIALLDTSLLSGRWKLKLLPISTKPIFEIEKQSYLANQFLGFVANKQEPIAKGSDLKVLAQRYYKQYVDKQLLEYEEMNLEKKYPEFKALMSEVYDGILLSQVMTQQVWDKSIADTTGQRLYYEAHKDKYRYPERATATIITADNDSLVVRTKEALSTSPPYQLRRKGTDLIFDNRQTDLTSSHRESLFDVAITMLRNENYLIEVSGFSDSTEPDSLSGIRIRNAVKALTNNRIPLSRVMEKDNGKFKPTFDAVKNRRVSFQYFSTSKKDIEKTLNDLKIGTVNISESVLTKNTNKYIDDKNWKVGSFSTMINGKKAWISIGNIELSRIKKLNEARGAVINDYQRQLEKDLLTKLKVQFPVIKNEEELKKLVIRH
jgi:peptidyl-prolyl cis-trans isomerase SurA